ncbi:MAG: lipoate--protein ligase family protein [Candidatus Eremiobacteraeota bacterium]|nr:lipoate--protein ligase family protein [Candidatus Eremiobacteraeota bacterium]
MAFRPSELSRITKKETINTLRIINDGVHPGSFNMAADEALLVELMKNPVSPTLRFYQWEKPTLSLGYFQKINEVNIERIEAKGYDIVRRPTGGRAVLHWEEVTFCLVIPAFKRGLWEIFKSIHEALESGLNMIGISARVLPVEKYGRGIRNRTSACFASPSRYELMLNGKKIAGTAQKKVGDYMLAHGSIPIRPKFKYLFEILNFQNDEEREIAYKNAVAKMTSLYGETGLDYLFEDICNALISGFEKSWGCNVYEDNFTSSEIKLIANLEEEKYNNPGWLFRY